MCRRGAWKALRTSFVVDKSGGAASAAGTLKSGGGRLAAARYRTQLW